MDTTCMSMLIAETLGSHQNGWVLDIRAIFPQNRIYDVGRRERGGGEETAPRGTEGLGPGV